MAGDLRPEPCPPDLRWFAAEAAASGAATPGHPKGLSHDAEFARRRRRNTIGQHVWLRCTEPRAPTVLSQHLPDVVDVVGRMPDVVIEVRPDRLVALHPGPF